MDDPRDALLAAVWAERLIRLARRSPPWALPLRRRPRGWRAWAWLLHLAWILGITVFVDYRVFFWLHGVWRWVLLGVLGYSALVTPFAITRTLRACWNAPEAARRNRELVDS